LKPTETNEPTEPTTSEEETPTEKPIIPTKLETDVSDTTTESEKNKHTTESEIDVPKTTTTNQDLKPTETNEPTEPTNDITTIPTDLSTESPKSTSINDEDEVPSTVEVTTSTDVNSPTNTDKPKNTPEDTNTVPSIINPTSTGATETTGVTGTAVEITTNTNTNTPISTGTTGATEATGVITNTEQINTSSNTGNTNTNTIPEQTNINTEPTNTNTIPEQTNINTEPTNTNTGSTNTPTITEDEPTVIPAIVIPNSPSEVPSGYSKIQIKLKNNLPWENVVNDSTIPPFIAHYLPIEIAKCIEDMSPDEIKVVMLEVAPDNGVFVILIVPDKYLADITAILSDPTSEFYTNEDNEFRDLVDYQYDIHQNDDNLKSGPNTNDPKSSSITNIPTGTIKNGDLTNTDDSPGSSKKPFVILAVIGSTILYVAFTILVIKAYKRSRARAAQQQEMIHTNNNV
ncbi:8179_t:CDS:2, partial [Diversispora eburnea]